MHEHPGLKHRIDERIGRRDSVLRDPFSPDGSFSDVHGHAPLPIESEHIVRLRIGALHPGRSDRHSLNNQSDHWRLFLQQPPDRVNRDMPFDYIAFQQRDVALPEPGWHPVLRMHRIQLRLRDVIVFDLEAVISQVT